MRPCSMLLDAHLDPELDAHLDPGMDAGLDAASPERCAVPVPCRARILEKT